jgi:hypothetical protein
MSKMQTIIWLFVFLIIMFSMDIIFGYPLRETFKGDTITSYETQIELQDEPLSANMAKNASDDEPLTLSFGYN